MISIPKMGLSFQPPWGWLCLTNLKDIENRSKKWEFAELRIFLHSSKTYDKECLFWVASHFGNDMAAKLSIAPVIYGAIIGEITLQHYVTESTSNWFFGPYGYPIRDGLLYQHSYPMRGFPGFFSVPLEIRKQIKQSEAVEWAL